MARSSYFSGDLAALNDAMASEERNRIAGRQANQMFLANLVGESTKRRGQDVEERMGQQRNETLMGMEGIRAGAMDRASNDQLRAARLLSDREMQRIQTDMERIRQAEAEGIRVDAREKAKLTQAAKDAEANRNQLLAVTLIQALTQRTDPRLAVAQFETNAGIDAANAEAEAAAAIANQGLLESERGWLKPKSAEVPNISEAQTYLRGLPLDQQSLLAITNDASGARYIPRLRQPYGARPVPQQPQPVTPRTSIPIGEIFRGTNLPAGTGSPLMTNIVPRAGQQVDLRAILDLLSQQR